ncbi:MAG TPA: universal stress protein [Bacteroidales bacterium]|nr:universal stress protein [Bacteroidales bacterium]
MKTLLAIINEWENTKEFIKYAARLSKDLNTHLTLLTVQNPRTYSTGTQSPGGAMPVNVQEVMKEVAQKEKQELLQLSQEVTTELSLKNNMNVLSEIGITKMIVEELVSNHKADMVILNSEPDASFWEQSVTNKDIIYDINCPVWVIPEKTEYVPYSKVVYATNYKEEDIRNMKKLLKLAGTLNPEIVALHITDTTDFEEKVKQKGFLETLQKNTGYSKIKVKALKERENDNVAQLINDYSSDIDANLIVLLKENRNFLDRLFNPGATRKLIKEAKLPVLIFHEKEE